MTRTFWMITNRRIVGDDLICDRGRLAFFVSSAGEIDNFSSWQELPQQDFLDQLKSAADEFPRIDDRALHEEQKHITLFVHGYNNNWRSSARMYARICDQLFNDQGRNLGLCILFAWPSDGMLLNYLPDRADARESAPDLAEILSLLHDHLLVKQPLGARDAALSCKAKTSIIAHSMGNYVLQKAMHIAWTRHNQPLLVSLINQLIMVAADIDNDVFGNATNSSESDGEAIANLTYRVTALYSGRDSVLGMSAGLKHFGKRRLGRSGLDRTKSLPDNVWDVDCSKLFSKDERDIHSGYFREETTLNLMEVLLRGVDRNVIMESEFQSGNDLERSVSA
ncbi:MAG TPA: alpha/beta hydrolase [Phycisphaerales bacterium]|nr:alpha/beta hydrolase [Phycisphaerales bacterium]